MPVSAGTRGARAAEDPVFPGARVAAQATLVDGVGDEPAHVIVHAIGDAEKDAAIGGHGGVPLEEVLQAGHPGLARVSSLGGLAELHLVAHRTRFEVDVPTATALASENWPASSMKR